MTPALSATYQFHGSVAVVTGAGGDLGRAAAVRLSAGGAAVALVDRPEAAAAVADTAGQCQGEHPVLPVLFDVTDHCAVDDGFRDIADALGAPRLLVNNAGIQGQFATVDEYDLADARQVFEVNVLGALAVLKAASRAMREAGLGGAVVNAASMAGVSGAANMVAYSASKGAVISMTRAAAKDLAPYNIRVNSVSPAFIGPGRLWERQSELQAATGSRYYATDAAIVREQMIEQVPMRRLGSAQEVASVVTWLLSQESSYITGDNILITGGIV